VLRPPSRAEHAIEQTDALEVITSLAGGSDPLLVGGTRLAYRGLTDATRQFLKAATAAWVQQHGPLRRGGWQLLIEITRTDAEMQAGNITVELETRATLRGTTGQVHLGQTHGYCRVVRPLAGDGSPVVYECLDRMSRDLAGWLEGQVP